MSDRPKYPSFTVAINPDRTVIMIMGEGDPRRVDCVDLSQATFFKVEAPDALAAIQLAGIEFDKQK